MTNGIIDARELVAPSTRPHNERLTRYQLEHYSFGYNSRFHVYNSRRPSPVEISAKESELAMKSLESIL